MKRAILVVLFATAGRALAADPAPVVRDTIPFEGGRYVVALTADLGCVVALQGAISRAATLSFDTAIDRAASQGCTTPWLLLESPGGRLADGIELGRAVRLQGLRTVTRYDCSSACGLIFLGGTERLLVGSRARIGFHQASQTYRDERLCLPTLQTQAARDIRRYLHWVAPGSAEALVETIMRTGCTSMEFVGGQRALDLRVATRLERPDEDVFGPRQRRGTPERRE